MTAPGSATPPGGRADGRASEFPDGFAADLAGQLARAFASAIRQDMDSTGRDAGDPAELRAALHEYVARLRAGGAPPERVLVGVKAAAAQGSLAAWYPHETQREAATRQEAAVLTERLVRWAVLAYYGEAST